MLPPWVSPGVSLAMIKLPLFGVAVASFSLCLFKIKMSLLSILHLATRHSLPIEPMLFMTHFYILQPAWMCPCQHFYLWSPCCHFQRVTIASASIYACKVINLAFRRRSSILKGSRTCHRDSRFRGICIRWFSFFFLCSYLRCSGGHHPDYVWVFPYTLQLSSSHSYQRCPTKAVGILYYALCKIPVRWYRMCTILLLM